VPSRKEIQWSQLKVGSLVLAAMVVLIGLIFLMSGTTGGLFGRKLVLRAYFANAAGLKDGAVVSVDGVTIGNVKTTRVVPERNPYPVEVAMQVGEKYWADLHTDSTVRIAPAGVLGDSFVDIDSRHATGPRPADNSELTISGSPTIEDVIGSSKLSIDEIDQLMVKIGTLIDTLNTTRGTFGEIINDPGMKKNVVSIAANLQTITQAMADGKGSLGKFLNDDSLYTKMDSTVDQLNAIVSDMNAGKGTAGKLLKDETAYNNFNSAVKNLSDLLASLNSGKGAMGQLVNDPDEAKKLNDAITNLDGILKGVNAGEGSAGQFVKNTALYDHANQTMDQAQQLIKAIRADPKKYLVIQMKVF
jgi:phospholipid/cholesterol/gamma-HCH transport system substrate-binding protein